MSECRMLSKKVTEDDNFIGLPAACQLLYVHLVMGADDDGFNNQTNMAKYKSHATDEDLKTLAANKFIIMFENSNVILIKHWRISNRLRKDGYVGTTFKDLFAQVYIKPNGAYTLRNEEGFISAPLFISRWLEKAKSVTEVLQSRNDSVTTPLRDRNETVTQEKNKNKNKNKKREEQEKKRDIAPSDDGLLPFEPTPEDQDNVREVEDPGQEVKAPKKQPKRKYGEYQNVLLTDKEVDKLKEIYGSSQTDEAITFLDEYIERKGYKAKSHYLTIRNWVMDAVEERKHKLRGAPPGNNNSLFAGVDAWLATKQISDGF